MWNTTIICPRRINTDMEYADLHLHSTKSDGQLSPSEIVYWGIKKNLKAISLTDHDNADGIDEAIHYAENTTIEVIPGVEFSTEYNGVEVHILGYFINYKDSVLKSFFKKLSGCRIERAQLILRKLKNYGLNIEFNDIISEAYDATSIGRPHIARAMVNKGICKSSEEAFNKYLSYGRPAYVERYKISPFEALEIITRIGGVTSIAHPGLIINIDKWKLIKKLKEWGLIGIEVYHTKHTNEDIINFTDIARNLSLIPTGGSDCHGQMINNTPSIGSVTIPYENVIMLKTYTHKFSDI